MTRSGVLLAAALALAACQESEKGGKGKAEGAPGKVVSVDGVVEGVKPDAVRVKTDDGKVLAFAMRDDVTVTLAGGEAQAAVVTEGAPVRLSYRPRGSGGELVSIDVEPQGASGGGQARAPAAPPADDPPADAAQAAKGR